MSKESAEESDVALMNLTAALSSYANVLATVSDPKVAARRVTAAIGTIALYQGHIAAVRAEAIAAWRAEGASYATISAVTGLSVSRVAQLARRPPHWIGLRRDAERPRDE